MTTARMRSAAAFFALALLVVRSCGGSGGSAAVPGEDAHQDLPEPSGLADSALADSADDAAVKPDGGPPETSQEDAMPHPVPDAAAETADATDIGEVEDTVLIPDQDDATDITADVPTHFDAGIPDVGLDTVDPTEPVDPYADGPFAVLREQIELELEPATGPFGSGRVAFDLDIYVPRAEGPFPLVVFSPAFQLAKENYVALGQRAASHGVLFVVPTYGDSALRAIDHSDLADYVSRFIDWTLAESASVGTALTDAVDDARIVTGGHSRGGKIAFLAAIRDERVAATFTFDPVDSTGNPIFPPPPTPENPSVTPELMPDFVVPGGMIGAGRGADGLVPCAPADEGYASYYLAVESTPFYLYEIPTAGHLDFAQDLGFITNLGCVGGDDPDGNRAFGNATLVAFVKAVVEGDSRYLPWVDGRELPADVVFHSQLPR